MKLLSTIIIVCLAISVSFANGIENKKNEGEKESAKVVNVEEVLKANPYPKELRALGIEGEVMVSFWLDTKGAVKKYRVEQSSHVKLEEYIIENVDKFRFTPAKNENGKAIYSRIKVPFIFELSI
ncbi:MAG: energy transducer TonB [Cytophagales bacterium]|nr:energy transducer TonB [Cytophagales bacterium]